MGGGATAYARLVPDRRFGAIRLMGKQLRQAHPAHQVPGGIPALETAWSRLISEAGPSYKLVLPFRSFEPASGGHNVEVLLSDVAYTCNAGRSNVDGQKMSHRIMAVRPALEQQASSAKKDHRSGEMTNGPISRVLGALDCARSRKSLAFGDREAVSEACAFSRNVVTWS
jgi:hypothetical protein